MSIFVGCWHCCVKLSLIDIEVKAKPVIPFVREYQVEIPHSVFPVITAVPHNPLFGASIWPTEGHILSKYLKIGSDLWNNLLNSKLPFYKIFR